MNRNIINPQDVGPFLQKLKLRHPQVSLYIDRHIKSYILKKENTFLIPEEQLGFSLWVKKVLKQGTPAELSMLKHQGAFGKYFKLNLNAACFERYSRFLAFAETVDPKILPKISFNEIMNLSRKEVPKTKIRNLIEGKDFKFIGSIKTRYSLIQLASMNSYENEGKEMQNCIGRIVLPTRNRRIYSLRNEKGDAVMSINTDPSLNEVIEAKGFNNAPADSALLRDAAALLKVKVKPSKDLLFILFNTLVSAATFSGLYFLLKFFNNDFDFSKFLTHLVVFCFGFFVYFLYTRLINIITKMLFFPFHTHNISRREDARMSKRIFAVKASVYTGVLTLVAFKIMQSHLEITKEPSELLGSFILVGLLYLIMLLFVWVGAWD